MAESPFSPVELRFDGQRFAWWQSVSIKGSVDDLCAGVQLGVTLPGTGQSLGLTANTLIEVLASGELIGTVRIDSLRRTIDKDSHTISVEARSLGRELVDCQYSKNLNGLRLGEIVKQLCTTFKVPCKVIGDTALVPHFAMQCETPANALINAARTANKLLYATPDGGIILTDPDNAAPVATLRYGESIKSYDIVDEHRLRYSDYVVKSFDYEGGAALKHAVKDAGLTYFRPLHIVADKHGGGLGACQRRAELERNRRLARAHRLELMVPGWMCNGQVWAINKRVRVVIDPEGIDDVYLIGERSLRFDARSGTSTHLVVMRREAFLGEAVKKSKRNAKGTPAGQKGSLKK